MKVVFCLALPTSAAVGQDEADLGATFWNQDRGNGAGDGFVDVAPIRADPVVRWRSMPGELIADPVIWGGQVFCAVAKGRQGELVAIDSTTGEQVGHVGLGTVRDVRLLAWQGMVAVATDKVVRTYKVRGSSLRKDDTLRLPNHGAICAVGGTLFVRSEEDDVHAIDLARGRDEGIVAHCEGRMAALPDVLLVFGLKNPYGPESSVLWAAEVPWGTDDDSDTGRREEFGGAVCGGSTEQSREDAIAVPLVGLPYGERAWYVRPERPLCPGMPAQVFPPSSEDLLSPIVFGPILFEERFYGFDAGGNLIRQNAEGLYRTILETEARPPGSRIGPLTRAQGVAYAGNMAIDLASGRVLWVLRDVGFDGPMIPLADERVLVVDSEDSLVCLGAPAPLSVEGAEAVARDASASRVGSVLDLPPDEDGVVTADGAFRAGTIEEGTDGAILLRGADGSETEIPVGSVAVSIREGEVHRLGETYPVFEALRRALRRVEQEVLEEQFEAYRRSRLIAECRRILAEYEHLGLPRKRHEELLSQIAGRGDSREANRKLKLEKVRSAEQAGRAQVEALYHQTSSWCAEHGLPLVATLVEEDLKTFVPEATVDLDSIARWMPPTFPFRDEDHAAEAWLTWASELGPAGAHFLDAEDPRVKGSWAENPEATTLALTTRNLLLFTRSTDPAVVGVCVRSGEGVVRRLDELFGAERGASVPLEVRVYQDRDSFRAELIRNGDIALEWAAGFFSPVTHASTFYVPKGPDGTSDLDQLRRVLAHELTHHFFSERWDSSQSRNGSGSVWAIEGVARYFEEQAVELGSASRPFGDETVPSVDATALLVGQGESIPLQRLLRMDYTDFLVLGSEERATVTLRYTLGSRNYNERSIFYAESGALVFFLLHRAGKTARSGMLEYLKHTYAGGVDGESWRLLGFDSIDDLEAAFHAFLESLAD